MQNPTVKKCAVISAVFLAMFLLLIILLKTADVQPVGPNSSSIGLAGINTALSTSKNGELSPMNNFFYNLTEIIGYVAILLALCFAAAGVFQLVKGKSFAKVNTGIYLLGGVYVLLGIIYVFFEKAVVNFRPIIIDGDLEAAFPSSHTLLSLCIFATAMLHILRQGKGKKAVKPIFAGLMVLATAGRLLSGVHWFTDILGSILLSGAVIFAYAAAASAFAPRKKHYGD